jgi:hypothetical protein
MASTRIEDLAYELQPLCAQFLDDCDEWCGPEGRVILTCTYRSVAEQQALKDKYGNTRPIATPGKSLHGKTLSDGTPAAEAFDFMFVENGKLVMDGSDPLYAKAGEIAESLGLEWGGRWKHPKTDYDHAQLKQP